MRGSRMPFGSGTRCGIWYRLRSKTWKTPHLPISVGDISENFTDRILRGASSSAKGVLLYSRGAPPARAGIGEPGAPPGGTPKARPSGSPSSWFVVSHGSVARATDDSARRVPRARERTRARTRGGGLFGGGSRELTQRIAAAAVLYQCTRYSLLRTRGVSRSSPSPGGSGVAIGQRPRPPDGLLRGLPGFPQPARVQRSAGAYPNTATFSALGRDDPSAFQTSACQNPPRNQNARPLNHR